MKGIFGSGVKNTPNKNNNNLYSDEKLDKMHAKTVVPLAVKLFEKDEGLAKQILRRFCELRRGKIDRVKQLLNDKKSHSEDNPKILEAINVLYNVALDVQSPKPFEPQKINILPSSPLFQGSGFDVIEIKENIQEDIPDYTVNEMEKFAIEWDQMEEQQKEKVKENWKKMPEEAQNKLMDEWTISLEKLNRLNEKNSKNLIKGREMIKVLFQKLFDLQTLTFNTNELLKGENVILHENEGVTKEFLQLHDEILQDTQTEVEEAQKLRKRLKSVKTNFGILGKANNTNKNRYILQKKLLETLKSLPSNKEESIDN